MKTLINKIMVYSFMLAACAFIVALCVTLIRVY
jgi:hypothetical protein